MWRTSPTPIISPFDSLYLIYTSHIPTYEPVKHVLVKHILVYIWRSTEHLGNVASALASGTAAASSLWEFLGIHPHDGLPKRIKQGKRRKFETELCNDHLHDFRSVISNRRCLSDVCGRYTINLG